MSEKRIIEVATETRNDHPNPPDGPKALDRAIERAAQRDAQEDVGTYLRWACFENDALLWVHLVSQRPVDASISRFKIGLT
ncbi:hypothetical protein O4H61_08995 [Roseovarius aestuarii]|nr:hypothetical protein [Roseovarius aestuarii]